MRWLNGKLLAMITLAGTATVLVPVSTASASTPPIAPPGYVRVQLPPAPAPPGEFDSGAQIKCPKGTVVWGGGAALFGGGDVGQNINTSEPIPGGWAARVNNSSHTTNDFTVHAICAKKPLAYKLVFKTVPNPAGQQNSAIAGCPKGTVLFDGGALSTADTVEAFLLSAFPKSSTAYKAVMWNGTAMAQQLTVYALCGHKPARYTLVNKTINYSNNAPVRVFTSAPCPAGTAILGGGVKVANPKSSVYLADSLDDPTQWEGSTVDTNSSATGTVTTSAICAA